MKFDNYYKIIVFTPKYGEQQIIIDIDDFDKVKTYHWYIKDGYPSANIMLNGYSFGKSKSTKFKTQKEWI